MPAPTLIHQRCFHHGDREAAARCPACGRYYCRECVVEHDDRLLCSSCIKKLAPRPFTQRGTFTGVVRAVQCCAGFMLLWFFFYAFGERLLKLPSSFHEGTLWRVSWFDRE